MGRSFTKWSKYKIMRENASLRTYLPETKTFSEANLKSATKSHAECVLKPSGSSGGFGVMVVKRKTKGFTVQSGRSVHSVRSFSALYKRVGSRIKRGYLIQKRIRLAKVEDCLFDIRVMVQRHRGASDWKVTGSLAKVGGRGFIITNTSRSRGYVLPLRTALKRSGLPAGASASIPAKLERIAMQTVRTLHPKYRWIRSVGMDFGVDTAGRIWIIEANFEPSLGLFRKLKDKTMYRRIVSY